MRPRPPTNKVAFLKIKPKPKWYPRLELPIAVVMAATLCLPVACIEDNQIDPDNNVLIGLMLPFTGGDAALGSAYERAAIMARDEVNDAGGIGGKPIQFVTQDTHSDPAKAAVSLEAILHYPTSAILGPESSEIARDTLPLSATEKTTLISPVVSGAASIDIPTDVDWFRLAPSSALMGRAFANYIFDQGVTSIAAVYAEEDYHLDYAEAFTARFTELGGDAAGTIVLPPDQNSYRVEISELKNFEPSNVLLSASTADAARFINDAVVDNSTAQFQWYLSPPLETPVLIENTYKGACEGAIGIGIQVHDEAEEFIEQYQARWNDSPIDGAYYYYDAVALLALSLERAFQAEGKIAFETVQQMIRQTAKPLGIQIRWDHISEGLAHIREGQSVHYSGLTGSVVFDEYGQQVIAPMKIWKVESDTFISIDEL